MGIDAQLLTNSKTASLFDKLVEATEKRGQLEADLHKVEIEQRKLVARLLDEGMTTRYLGNATGLSHTKIGSMRGKK